MDKQKKRILLIAGIAIILVLVAILLISVQSDEKKLNDLLNLGEKYLDEMQYESAIAVFDEAIAIEPKCAAAYMGKAKAQYALELYEDAVDTLREGIEKVEEPAELETFLQQILNELPAKDKVELETAEAIVEEVHTPIMLNYTQIVRRIDTDDPVIQLEVLGGHDEKFIWESSNPECAMVSDTGLVTCQPEIGYAYITVTTEAGNGYSDSCVVIITSESDSESEIVRILTEGEDESQEQYLVVEVCEEDESQIAKIIGDVYFSGDVLIPEHLSYNNKLIPITYISSSVFYWSYEMKSVFIPAFVENVGESEYYFQNPFGFCLNLEEIRVDEKNEFFQSVDGVLYSKDGKQLISYPAAKKDSTYTIPKEVEKIYTDAFSGCTNLEEILVEDGNQYYESVDGALIEVVKFDTTLIDMEEKRLVAYPSGNKALSYTVPENVTSMADKVFYGCSLEEVICRSVEVISSAPFWGCDNLKKVECGQGTRYIYIDSYEDINSIEIAGLNIAENLEQLSITLSETQDISAFSSLKKLRRLSLDVNGRTVDLQALGDLSNLTYLELNGLDNIKDISWIGKLENLESLHIYIGTLSDISWLADTEKLQYFRCYMEKSEIKDLMPLLELKNLKSVSMYSWEDVVDEDIKKQIDELKEKREDVNFSIFE